VDGEITFFRYSGTSIPETEIIYHIISSILGSVEEEKIAPIDSRIHTIIEIHFPIPYGDEFFVLFGADKWLKLRNVITEIKKRRGRSEMQIVFSFPGVSRVRGAPRLIFQTLETDYKSVERAVDGVQVLVEAIESQMSKFPTRVLEMTYCYESALSRWRPDFAKTDKRTYKYTNGNWIT
jgi:hypothetical protein